MLNCYFFKAIFQKKVKFFCAFQISLKVALIVLIAVAQL